MVLLGAATAAGLAAPMRAADDPAARHTRRLEALRRDLGLSDTQVGALERMAGERREAAAKRRAHAQAVRKELDSLLDAGEPDRAVAADKIHELGALHEEALRSLVERRLAVQQILTPEQRAKLQVLRDERRQRFERLGRRFQHWRRMWNRSDPELW
jgi:Spy/CpxP family protein refolding chaperone